MSVIISDSAAREISNIIHQQGLDADKIRLRVGVKGGGCSGFSYILDLTEVQKDSDELWEFTYRTAEDGKTVSRVEGGNGGTATAVAEAGTFTVRVVCDPKSFLYLNGTTIGPPAETVYAVEPTGLAMMIPSPETSGPILPENSSRNSIIRNGKPALTTTSFTATP
jgi:iron-sulfur cluster assembly protein